MMIPAVRRHNLVVKILLIGFMTVALLIGCAIMVLGALTPGNQTTDRTGDWAAFYKENVEGAFNIPTEAEILLAKEYDDFPMGGGYLVSFRLPETKKPEEWLKAIVTADLAKHKNGPYRYDGSGKISDVYWIEYRPTDRTYVARWHWD